MSYRPSLKQKAPQINLPHPKYTKAIIYEYFYVDSEDTDFFKDVIFDKHIREPFDQHGAGEKIHLKV